MSADDVGTAAPAFFGHAGATFALVLANMGAAYGTAKSGVGIASMGIMAPEAVMKNMIPVVMAGVLGIYGLIISVLLITNIEPPQTIKLADGEEFHFNVFNWDKGFSQLAAGLCVGLSSIGAGYSIGLVGEAGTRAIGLQPRLFVALILVLIFSEALALYGMITSLILITSS